MRSMEVLTGETACYRTMDHVALKIELNWRA